MKKLFHQMMKFGLVGVICFVIDYITGLIAVSYTHLTLPTILRV